MSFYAVRSGRKIGIFNTWSECEEQVKKFSGAQYKKFKTLCEAENYLRDKPKQVAGTATKHRLNNVMNSKELEEQKEIEDLLKEALENEDMLPPAKKKKTNDKDSVIKLSKYGNYFFDEDDDGHVKVFTDGSCENNGQKGAIAGFGVFFRENHPLNSSEPVIGRATNNIGEIKASIKAISDAQKCGILKLNIFTDSKFLINSVCKWMSTWKSNDWKLATGKPVVNQEDFKVLDKLINSGSMLIKWTYIEAHKGHYGNEQADRLAKEGARKQRT